MIHLTNITRQHGTHVLFKNASFQVTTGLKVLQRRSKEASIFSQELFAWQAEQHPA